MTKMLSLAVLLLLAACGAPPADQAEENDSNIAINSETPITATEARVEGGLPGKPTEVATENVAADAKGPVAARDLVETYAELLRQGRFQDAHRLWSGDERTDAQFAAKWKGYGRIESAAVEAPGRLEGAAGSIYAEVPIQLFGTARQGQRFSLSGKITLRRVNDVPGSTEEQRRWHIVKSDLEPVD